MAQHEKLLRIYLNDHLAGAIAGHELAKRAQAANDRTPLGDLLRTFIAEVEEERAVIEQILDAIDAQPDRIKQMAAWIAEKVGRLKLNGQVTGYSDLSRLIEIEGLCLGVEGKASLWRSLLHVQPHHPVLEGFAFDVLIERAERQRRELEALRIEAATVALTPLETAPDVSSD